MANIFPSIRHNVWHTPRGLAFSSEYQTVYDLFTTKPSSAVAAAQNTMVESLVDGGVWDILDILYILANNIEQNALLNWISPGTFDKTPKNAPTFIAYEGYTGGGNKYLDTNWNPTLNGINYIQDSASMGCYSRTDLDDASWDFGVRDGTMWAMAQLRNGGNFNMRINDATSGSSVQGASTGMYVLSREGANIQRGYRNKSQIVNTANVSTGVANFKVYSLAYSSSGVASSFSSRQQSLFFCGGGLTQNHVNTFTDAFEAYMDLNGKGVI